MFSEIVRLRLIEERNAAGYTQQELANLTSINKSTIAKIEAGLRKPDVETVGQLANFFGISTDYLFGLGKRETKNHV